jgi:hypothetical protein
MIELVLPHSAVHVQWNIDVNGWRILADLDARGHEAATVPPVAWRPWTGDSQSVIRMSVRRGTEGAREKWWALAGELPSPDAVVGITVGSELHPAVSHVQDRVWACEWTEVISQKGDRAPWL